MAMSTYELLHSCFQSIGLTRAFFPQGELLHSCFQSIGLTRAFFPQGGVCTPVTLSKASNAAQRLQWRLSRVVKSRLPEGLSRESIQKIVEHFWATKGEDRCRAAMTEVMAEEGQRVSTDHTYHVVSNLAAQGEDGKFVALKASLVSVMGQDYAIGFKARAVLIMRCKLYSNVCS